MTDDSMAARRRIALRDFKRLMIYLVIVGLVMVAAAILYLVHDGPLTGTLVFTTTAGVFVSVVLGGGLMAAGFFSSASGVDEEVAAAGDQRGAEPLDDQTPERDTPTR